MRDVVVVEFRDDGQDFLKWTVDTKTGDILESFPFQTEVWSQFRVINLLELVSGIARNALITEKGKLHPRKVIYPVISAEVEHQSVEEL